MALLSNHGRRIAGIALLVLFLSRHHFFDAKSRLGQAAFGMLVGGIVGNVTDRLLPSRLSMVLSGK